MQNAGFLFAAYAIIWAVFFGYLVLLHNRQRKISREIDTLRSTLDKKDRDG